MAIFGSLNNSEKQNWISLLTKGEPSIQLLYIIDNFFIKDNIDRNKYHENYRANATINGFLGLTYFEQVNSVSVNKENPINCTSTFRKHFADNKSNRATHIPDWFYIGYPDVAYWCDENGQIIEREIQNRNLDFISNDKIDIEYFRFLINFYMEKTHLQLECSKNFVASKLIDDVNKIKEHLLNNPDKSIELFNAKLSGVNLTEASLSEAKLVNADLSEANLTEAHLFDSDLTRVNFENATLNITMFDNSVLTGANFKNADLEGASLRDTNLTSSNFSNANLSLSDCIGANLSLAKMTGAKAHKANFSSCKFFGTDLTDVDFSDAYLMFSDFTGANITRTNFSGANMTGVIGINL